MADVDPAGVIRRIRLRYAGVCSRCAIPLARNTWADYDRQTRTVACLVCRVQQAVADEPAVEPADVVAPSTSTRAPDQPANREPSPVTDGTAGASARRTYDRRRTAREQRVRTRFPRIGGLLLRLFDETQSTTAWETGAVGEAVVGGVLNGLAGAELRVLHDRRIPGTRANLDHLAVCPGGVFVIDAKSYRGRPRLRIEGGILRPRVERLTVGGARPDAPGRGRSPPAAGGLRRAA